MQWAARSVLRSGAVANFFEGRVQLRQDVRIFIRLRRLYQGAKLAGSYERLLEFTLCAGAAMQSVGARRTFLK